MKDLPLLDLHNDCADISDDVVGHANNDVPVVEEAEREHLAGRVRPNVRREAG